jgi:hypothetical protein
MASVLNLSVGMPRAGSGWYYNLIHDLIVASGGQDAREVRKRFFLKPILTEVNCNIGSFSLKRLVPVLLPTLFGNEYVIKAHAEPSPLASQLINSGRIRASYIYRDPRDALLSAFEYGQRKRRDGGRGAFAELMTIDNAIDFMEEYIRIAEIWISNNQVLHTRYEEFQKSYREEAERAAIFYGIDPMREDISLVIDRYQPKRGSRDQVGTHFVKGKIGRYQEELTKTQQERCIRKFGNFLEQMKYPIP